MGYVPGSITNGGCSNVTASTTMGNPGGLILPPGFTIQPGSTTLVWTYTGPNYNAAGGPFPETLFNGLTAESTLRGYTNYGGFSAVAEKNSGPTTGTPTYNTGYVAVPAAAAVPEPASWGLMLLGAGMAGVALRGRRPLGAA